MKFKYNFLENKLCRIEENYSYEISEENRKFHFTDLGCVFKTGESQWLILSFDKPLTKIDARYIKTSRSGESIRHEKKIILDQFSVETIFEFTEADRK